LQLVAINGKSDRRGSREKQAKNGKEGVDGSSPSDAVVGVHPLLPTHSSPAAPTIDFRPHARADFEIRLLGQTSDDIRYQVDAAAPYRVESGGYLYSRCTNRHFSSLVCLVTGPGHSSKHGRHSLRLSPAHEVEALFPDWMPAENFVRVGDFHSHPNGTPTPNRDDMQAWASVLRRRRHSTYVGVIVTPSPGDGSGPQLHGWVTRMDSTGKRFVVEPARVEEGDRLSAD
jgi:hypothetical protein